MAPCHQTLQESRMLSQSRMCGYGNMKRVPLTKAALHACGWLLAALFLATDAGVALTMLAVHFCVAGASPQFAAARPFATFITSSLITSCGSIATYWPLALSFEQLYLLNPGLRCQEKAWPHVQWPRSWPSLRRLEVRLALLNLVLAGTLTCAVGILRANSGESVIKLSLAPIRSVGDSIAVIVGTVAYFIWIDAWAYVAHRLLHFPWMYKNVHKWHHTFKQTTAFAGLGLHPVEFLLIQVGVYAALLFLPLHFSSVAVNLVYVQYHNTVDHSGVYLESPLPWQPTTLYHDDHHRLAGWQLQLWEAPCGSHIQPFAIFGRSPYYRWFHMNYGQTLTVWDRLGGTFYDRAREANYTEHTFSDGAAKEN